MFRSDRREHRPAVRSLTLLAVTLLGTASCSFPSSSSSGGSTADPTALPSAGSVPSGVTDPATDAKFAKFYDQKVTWSDCDSDMQCMKFTVPTDWSDPTGETIQISVNRLPAQGDDPIGSMVLNPGGPGVSGLDYAKVAKQAFGESILRNYSVVGFDPRGIGESAPVKCYDNKQYDAYTSADGTPDDQAEIDEAVAGSKEFAQACQANTDNDLLEHVDTLSTIKDMDVLRALLGDAVLSYHGASYGTYIGAWYAETFPWRVGRMTLDGAIDPSTTAQEYTAGQAEGFSRALRAFVTDCQSGGDCPLRGTVDEGLNQLATLVDRADSDPLDTGDPARPLTQALMLTGIAQALYAQQLWPLLSTGLTQATNGDGTGLLTLADAYLERTDNGQYGQTLAANPAIFCLDVPETRTPDEIAEGAEKLNEQFPPLGGSIGWGGLGCSQWPYKAVMERKELHAAGSAPILVLGTVDDPATPYEWAQALSSQLDAGRLLTWKGTVHTAYRQGSNCIDEKVEDYMLTGALPAEGTTCE
ncbi:alpha/beta hydrolase [Kineosporia succinea]|uniref:Pimeloyl-ACP methyl ester carboxylesterase n=1 Tax=Kineosporia succinea TaxID=84632 RepID=A0ABT9P055_9ACTN|nr:alpha/beta hydrolase [Kineosporia succinea]MDP9826053.1 pimeloyl-ACP methyl ester carboxylesterase [Kineosporia succinea]